MCAVEWWKSYLTGREQFVSVNGQNSSKIQIQCGVPQRSVLGSLLYVNDTGSSDGAEMRSFVDDANVFALNNIPALLTKQAESVLR